MFKSISLLVLLGAAGLSGCGSESSEPEPDAAAGTGGSAGSGGSAGDGGSAAGAGDTAGSTATDPEPYRFPDCLAEDNDDLCAPRGLPFVTHAFAHSYCTECTAPGGTLAFTQPEAGTLCLSGSMTTEEQDAGGIALAFPVYASEGLTPEHQTILERFNAEYLRITQLRFTVDRPPPGGIFLWATTLHKDECNAGDCVTGWFKVEDWFTDLGESGTVTVPFTDFVDDFGAVFDTRSISTIGIDAGPGAVDYCISDVQFLDAGGDVVEEQ